MESGQGVNPRVAVVTAWSLFILMMQSVSNYDSDIFFIIIILIWLIMFTMA